MLGDKYWPLLLTQEETEIWLDYGTNNITPKFLKNLAGKSDAPKWQLVNHEVPILVRDPNQRSIKNVMTLSEFEDHMARHGGIQTYFKEKTSLEAIDHDK